MIYNLDFTDSELFKYDEDLILYSAGTFSLLELSPGVFSDTSPSIIYTSSLFTSQFYNVKSDLEGDVSFFLIFDDENYYHDGAAWVSSDKTSAQTNDLADLQALLTEDYTGLPTFTKLSLGILLNSDGSTDASISSFQFEYEEVPADETVDTATVYFNVRDITNEVDDVTITITANRRGMIPYKNSVVVLSKTINVTTQDGYAEFDLIDTENMGVLNYYTFNIAGVRLNKTVPDTGGRINLLDLPDFG